MTSDQRTRNQRHSLDSIPCKWKECRERPTIKDTLICNYITNSKNKRKL